jgi:hypothetical protein
VVTLEVTALLAGGKALEIAARADSPERQADGSWICRVEVAPLNAQPLDVRGVDSFHAMWLACSLILRILVQLRDNGARLANHDGSDFPLEAYLAGLDEKR